MDKQLRDPVYALSVKQPWASLIMAGIKKLEIRKWPTRVRGPIWIHAGKKIDPRPEGWELINTPELKASAEQLGGLIGIVDVMSCRMYSNLKAFELDQALHRNAPDWFTPPRMYGFELANPRIIPFEACLGQTLFFQPQDIGPK